MKISTETHNKRREFLDYIFGLIRYEIHQGEDNPHRLEVLSTIYRDLLNFENLSQAEGWSRKKSKDELSEALDKIIELQKTIDGLKKELNKIDKKMKKDDILKVIDELKSAFKME